ncbi:MAG: hypothetical protein ACD_78C00399G0003, partial [uncultured bacterium (gcode 4)]
MTEDITREFHAFRQVRLQFRERIIDRLCERERIRIVLFKYAKNYSRFSAYGSISTFIWIRSEDHVRNIGERN